MGVPTIVGLLLALSAYIWHRISTASNKKLPPGPTPEPFIGNARHIPPLSSWIYYRDLGNKFGDVVYLSALGTPIVVLNSFKAAQDLLVKRASKYSDRPRAIVASDLMGAAKTIPFAPYGSYWRTQRKLFHQFLGKPSLVNYHDLIETEIRASTHRLLEASVTGEKPKILEEIRLTITQLILGVTYGQKVNSIEDELVVLNEVSNKMVAKAFVPGTYLVDIFPALLHVPSWFPGTGWRKEAERVAEGIRYMHEQPYNKVKQEMATGNYAPSFTSRMIEETSTETDEECRIWTSGTMYGAGVETTTNMILRFILAMVLNPDVQRKGQEEIDSVIKDERLPSMEDINRLPYIDCIIQELFRWEILTPFAVPHRLIEDDEYRSYRIPKGAIVIPNVWAMSQDAQIYPEPEKFIPERFVKDENNPSAEVPLDPREFAFGFGRRTCPGSDYAGAMLYMAIVSLLATTNVRKPLDEHGIEYVPSVEYSQTAVRHMGTFDCRFEPRGLISSDV